jgi:hypothetical protein
MMIRGIRVSRWFKQKDIKKLVQRAFPGTSVHIRNVDRRRYQIRWTGDASYEDMRTLADKIEAATSAKSCSQSSVSTKCGNGCQGNGCCETRRRPHRSKNEIQKVPLCYHCYLARVTQ